MLVGSRSSLRSAIRLRCPAGPLLAAGLVLHLFSGPAAAAFFNSPPDSIGDRRVELSWEPDLDDPLITGNTILRLEGRIETIHEPGRAVLASVGDLQGNRLYSYAEGETTIRRYDLGRNSSLPDLPLGDHRLTGLTLHASNRWLLGVLETGGVAVWDLGQTPVGQPVIYPSGGADVLGAVFYPNILDPQRPEFVTVSADDSVRVWSAPGTIMGPGYTVSVPGGSPGGLSISDDRADLAVGTNSGEVRVWDIRTQPRTPRLRLSGVHEAPVRRVAFTRDRLRLASIDTQGRAAIWRVSDGRLLAQFDTRPPESDDDTYWISFSPPAGRLIYVWMSNGIVELREGYTGHLYRESDPELIGERVTARFPSHDGLLTYVGDSDGRYSIIRAGLCRPSRDQRECFGGYMIWRSPSDDPDDKVLLRVYNHADSTWSFDGGRRAFSDPDSIIVRRRPPYRVGERRQEPRDVYGPHNGIPYYYSIVRFNSVYLEGAVFPRYLNTVHEGFYRNDPDGPPTPIRAQSPAFDSRQEFSEKIPRLRDVTVVPNPFEYGKRSSTPLGDDQIQFRHLPDRATIKIYSMAGDLVRVIEHGRGEYGQSQDTAPWDLRNSAGRVVATGIYLYRVEADGRPGLPAEVHEGRIALIR